MLYVGSGAVNLKSSVSNFILMIFIFISVISFFFGQGSLPEYFVKIWVLLRYILIYFIVINIKIDKASLDRFYKILAFCFSAHLFIGCLQLLDISFINVFFEAREGVSKIIRTEDTIKGTFKFGVFYGYFILVAFVLLSGRIKRTHWRILVYLLALTFGFFSGSRMVFLGLVGFILYTHYRKNKIFIGSSVGVVCLVIFQSIGSAAIDDIGSLLGLFTFDFWMASLSSGRLGIFNIVPMFFDSELKTILFGFSYDGAGITSFLYRDYDNLSAILQNNAIIGIEDVYWIAFLYYYGIFGIAFFGGFVANVLFRMRRIAKVASTREHYSDIKAVGYLLFFAILCAFVNQIFFIKTFSFYFWLFAAIATHPVRFAKS
ncbi:hypothetical protein N9E70_00280 [bacterium]|nr:hypothetical protein [bacterium]